MPTPEAVRAAQALYELCLERGLRLGGAESCTGGLIASAITAIAGVSRVFNGALITYSNQAKEELLAVPAGILGTEGAVSRACAIAMAEGAALKLRADVAWASTGIAGPDGGSVEKPVGLVWFAFRLGTETVAESRVFAGTRSLIQQQAALFAINTTTSLIEQRPALFGAQNNHFGLR